MPTDALSVLCAQLTRDLLTIAKFLYNNNLKFTQHSVTDRRFSMPHMNTNYLNNRHGMGCQKITGSITEI